MNMIDIEKLIPVKVLRVKSKDEWRKKKSDEEWREKRALGH